MVTTQGRSVPTLICFAGAGGTGKTSIVDALHNRLSFNRDGVEPACVIHRSIVREFYGQRGVPNEAAFLALEASERREFQLALYTYYITKLEEFVALEKSPTILCERSIFDHYAYTIYGSRELLDAEGMKVLGDGVRRFKTLRPYVFYMPYPTPWDASGADGFRARELAKDTIIDALIYRQLSCNRNIWTNTLPCVPVADRANAVIHSIWSGVATGAANVSP